VALSKGQPPKSPLASMLDPVRAAVGPALGPALGPMLGSVLGSSGGPAFMQPPIIETAVGPPAKSFPLHLVHAGRCNNAVTAVPLFVDNLNAAFDAIHVHAEATIFVASGLAYVRRIRAPLHGLHVSTRSCRCTP